MCSTNNRQNEKKYTLHPPKKDSYKSSLCKNKMKKYKALATVSMFVNGVSSSLLVASAFTTTTTTAGAFTKINAFISESSRLNRIHQHRHQHDHLKFKPTLNTNNNTHRKNNKKLYMSSIDRDNDEKDLRGRLKSWIHSALPPPPEDQLTFSGDVGSIFLYTFLDHAVNGMYDDWLNSPEVLVGQSASAALESSFAASADLSNSLTQTPLTGNSFPVWFDLTNSAPFGNIPLSSALPIAHHIHYAPAIQTAGMASVLLATTWMICGYFTGAFKFKNTLECSPTKAITATALNWFFTCVVMFAIAYASDSFVGSIDCLHKSVGLTKADEDFILDSLTVLMVWRFTLNSVLGYGHDD